MVVKTEHKIIYGVVRFLPYEAVDKSSDVVVIKTSEVSQYTIDDFLNTKFDF